MRTVQCKKMILGEGRPKICVPITAGTPKELERCAKAVAACPDAEIVEWRADWYETIDDEKAVREAMRILCDCLKDIPVLFTFRSYEEGGNKSITDGQYEMLVRTAVESGADIVDIELSKGDALVKRLSNMVQNAGIPVIVSSHDFEKTPSTETMIQRLNHMYELGADICKLAVMPHDPLDTLRLMEATWKAKTANPDMLLITMSMSAVGSISRVCGEVFGSVLTFGTVGKASAPGQLEADCLRKMLEVLHIQNIG